MLKSIIVHQFCEYILSKGNSHNVVLGIISTIYYFIVISLNRSIVSILGDQLQLELHKKITPRLYRKSTSVVSFFKSQLFFSFITQYLKNLGNFRKNAKRRIEVEVHYMKTNIYIHNLMFKGCKQGHFFHNFISFCLAYIQK